MDENQLDDKAKYILEQANIEVEHTRSWPTKVMVFYVAINAGVVTAILTIAGRVDLFSLEWKYTIWLAICIIYLWFSIIKIFMNNHKNYLKYRNIQVQIQKKFIKPYCEIQNIKVPQEWFIPVEEELHVRSPGWMFYASMSTIVMAATILIIVFTSK